MNQNQPKRLAIDNVDMVLAALSDPIIILDSNRVIQHVNASALELFGRSLQGRNVVQCFRQPHVIDAVDEVFKTHKEWAGEAKFPAPVERHLSVNINIVGNGDGVVMTVRDVTLMKRTEEMHSDFVANVSHELRSPLSSIMGFIETLQGPAKNDEEALARFLGIMVQEANRMARLIDDLLSLSRVQIQEHVFPDDEVDILGVLQNIADISAIKAEERNMEIRLQAGNLPFWVTGDSDQIMQVFQNLIDNAIKYGREGTPIEISCRRLERMPNKNVPAVAVEIRDQGEGIANNHIPRLTERFYRIDKARSRTIGGTGLGLAIVKHIISRHRGRLQIESKVGKGSAFTVLLPIRS